MKVTRHQLKRIISEILIKETLANRLTLGLKEEGGRLVLHVNESGITYDLFDYADASKQKGGLYGLDRQFEVDHGIEIPEDAIVIDYDGVGMGDLPMEQAWEWVSAEYANVRN